MRTGSPSESDLSDLAAKAAGNWQRFDSFGWHEQPYDAERWCHQIISSRDSELREQSNAAAIEAELEPYTEGDDPDVRFERHGHWAVGHVNVVTIRVYRPTSPAELSCPECGHVFDAPDARPAPEELGCPRCGGDRVDVTRPAGQQVTEAFRRWCELAAALEDYPVLDDEDYCRREYEATLENIEYEGKSVARSRDVELPDDWVHKTYTWLGDHRSRSVENCDDRGGYPREEDLVDAFRALGFRRTGSPIDAADEVPALARTADFLHQQVPVDAALLLPDLSPDQLREVRRTDRFEGGLPPDAAARLARQSLAADLLVEHAARTGTPVVLEIDPDALDAWLWDWAPELRDQPPDESPSPPKEQA